MPISASMLPEYDHEMSVTRAAMARAPEAQFGYQPHPKSMTLGALVSHLREIPAWGAVTLTCDVFEMGAPGAADDMPPPARSVAAELAAYDENLAAFRQLLAATDDAAMMAPWTFKKAGKVIFTMPRVGAIRAIIFNHTIHHRAQLGMYLRLLDVAVPSTYGPSADESGM